MSEKTVAAISTPAGEGGIAVIRISGDDAVIIADKCFRSFSNKRLSELDGYSALYGEVVYENTVIDDAVALVFLAPRSFTGENVVEISVHGGKLVANKALRAVLDCGAVPAEKGEFTKRAFLNGKMDLTKAESIINIITAKNETALKISRSAKNGRISKKIESVISKLLEIAASFAVYSDYPDEEIDGLDPETFSQTIDEISDKLRSMLETYDAGKIISEGIPCSIVGKPNVGKSTLMNLICQADRSIVTDVAGTTRDVVESTVSIGGTTLILSDTAGIRETNDVVEIAGINKSVEHLRNSVLVIAVFDLSVPLDDDDKRIIAELPENSIIVLNKNDLPNAFDTSVFKERQTVMMSAKNSAGLDLLTEAIMKSVKADMLDTDDAVLLNERQRNCVQRAYISITEAKQAAKEGMTLDAVGICVDDCLAALYELTGQRVTDKVTDEIFSRFCVGK